jgi:hypothetical protein
VLATQRAISLLGITVVSGNQWLKLNGRSIGFVDPVACDGQP